MATKSQKGMSWSSQAAAKAEQTGKYIKVGLNGGHLAISGAPKMFQKNPKFVYIPSMRLAGDENDVRTVITKYGGDANAALSQAITAQNYQTTMAKVFEDELRSYAQIKNATVGSKAAKTARQSKYTLKDLDWMAKDLQQVQFAPKQTGTKGVKSPQVGRTSRTRGAKKTMLERVHDAETKGKVLDVSNLEKGIRAISLPTGPRTKKVHVPGLAIVANRDKFANYEAAVRQLGQGYEHFIDQFKAKVMTVGSVMSPARSPTRSPKMQHLAPLQPTR